MTKSIVLLEIIFSIALFSIIALVSSQTILKLTTKDYNSRLVLNTNLRLETTRLFLSKNDMNNLRYIDNKLYFKEALLLDNIQTFSIKTNNNITTISICTKENICQTWKLRK